MTSDWDECAEAEHDKPNAVGDSDVELLDSIEAQLDDVESTLGGLDEDGG